ncbi:MAG TPA: ATP synthase F0 subunit B [Terriglobia bacterium]
MGEIFGEVGWAFVQAIPTIIFLALLAFALRRLFFGPLAAVLKAREEQTKGALARARERASLAEAKAAEYEAVWLRARQELYGLREADRRQALAEREALIHQARERADVLVEEAQASLAAEAESARRDLSQASGRLAAQIAETILGGRTGPDGQEARS